MKRRLSCRIDVDLMRWVTWYARQRNTTVTQLITDFFLRLRAEHDSMRRVEVDQL